MTTETISGKCPCCGYDKMVIYDDSAKWNLLEGCPNCGFGYSDNYQRENPKAKMLTVPEAWMGLAEHWLKCADIKCKGLSGVELRRKVFDYVEKSGRNDYLETTLFEYTQEEIEKYLATKPVIFKKPTVVYKDGQDKGYTSCREKYERLREKNEYFAMAKSLGFKEPADGQSALHGVRHLINFSDVETVVHWLYSQGFDVIKAKRKKK